VPAHVWSDEVCCAEDVEHAAQRAAGDAVHDRAVPGDLWAVDAQVWGDGAVEALLGEDLVAVGELLDRGLGRGQSIRRLR